MSLIPLLSKVVSPLAFRLANTHQASPPPTTTHAGTTTQGERNQIANTMIAAVTSKTPPVAASAWRLGMAYYTAKCIGEGPIAASSG